MKIKDDKQIIDLIKQNENYEIKTSSNSIISNYLASKNEEPVKKKRYFLKFGVPALALASSLLIIIPVATNLNNNQVEIPTNEFKLGNNSVLVKELATFSSFNFSSDKTSTNNLSKIKCSKEKENEVDEYALFKKIANKFNSISYGATSLFFVDNTKIKEETCQFKFENTTYTYKASLSINEELLGTFYLPTISEKNNVKALYINADNTYYDVKLKHKNEAEEDEREEKTEATFTSLDKDDKTIIVIKKEAEYEGTESENSFSISYYKNKNEYNNDRISYSLKYEIENEDNEEKAEISIKESNKKTNFKDIIKVDDTHYSFICEEIDNSDGLDDPINLNITKNYKEYTYKTFNYKI